MALVGTGAQIIDESGRRVGFRRPVALPDGLDDEPMESARGRVVLPLSVHWTGGADRVWDLDDRRDRRRVYEIVLTEGSEADIRRFIDVDELIRLWSELLLPPYVREAWRDYVARTRGIDLGC